MGTALLESALLVSKLLGITPMTISATDWIQPKCPARLIWC